MLEKFYDRMTFGYPTNETAYRNALSSLWAVDHQQATKDHVIDPNTIQNLSALKTSIVNLGASFITEIDKDLKTNTFDKSSEITHMINVIQSDETNAIEQTRRFNIVSAEPYKEIQTLIVDTFLRILDNASDKNLDTIQAEFNEVMLKKMQEVFNISAQEYERYVRTTKMPTFDISKFTDLSPKEKLKTLFLRATVMLNVRGKQVLSSDDQYNKILRDNLIRILPHVKITLKGKSFNAVRDSFTQAGVKREKNITLDFKNVNAAQNKDKLISLLNWSGMQGWISSFKGLGLEKIIEENGKEELIEKLMDGLKLQTTGVKGTTGGLRADIDITSANSIIEGISVKNITADSITLVGETNAKTILNQWSRIPSYQDLVSRTWQQLFDNTYTGVKTLINDQETVAQHIKNTEQINKAAGMTILQGSALRALNAQTAKGSTNPKDFHPFGLSEDILTLEKNIQSIWAIQNARAFIGVDVKTMMVLQDNVLASHNSLEMLTSLILAWYQIFQSQYQLLDLNEKQSKMYSPIRMELLPYKIWQDRKQIRNIWLSQINPERVNLPDILDNAILDNYIKDRAKIGATIATNLFETQKFTPDKGKPLNTQINNLNNQFEKYINDKNEYLQLLDKSIHTIVENNSGKSKKTINKGAVEAAHTKLCTSAKTVLEQIKILLKDITQLSI